MSARETIVYRTDGGRTLTVWARGAEGKEFAAVVFDYQRAKEKAAPSPSSAVNR